MLFAAIALGRLEALWALPSHSVQGVWAASLGKVGRRLQFERDGHRMVVLPEH